MSAAHPHGPSRLPVLVALVALLVAAIVANEVVGGADARTPPAARAVAQGPSVAPDDALSTTWFCAEGTSNPNGRADETIVVGNLADHRVDATVTVMPNTGDAVSRQVAVAARSQARVKVSDVLATPEPGVVVEITGGSAVVEHEVRGQGDVAVEPCTRDAARDWYFAGGTTVRGSQQFLALFNPFGEDAIADVVFLTDTGVQEPSALQALVVPRQRRVTIAVHDILPRQQVVAAEVHLRSGRVVAERSHSFDGSVTEGQPTRRGIALSLGSTETARSWQIPAGRAENGASMAVTVANFDRRATAADVAIVLDTGAELAPQHVDIPSRGVVRVDVGAQVPAGSRYAVSVRVAPAAGEGQAHPVVVEGFAWSASPSSTTGVATIMGAPTRARRWVLAAGRAGDSGDGTITVVNPGSHSVTVHVRVLNGGGASATGVTERTIAALQRGTFDLRQIGAGALDVVVVVADGPVVVGASLEGSGGSSMRVAIPDYGR